MGYKLLNLIIARILKKELRENGLFRGFREKKEEKRQEEK